MDPHIPATKLRVPPPKRDFVPRAGLIQRLEQVLAQRKLTLVSAPAGFGKTSLLIQWAHSSACPVAWLSLSEDDNDFERFFRGLLLAWQRIRPEVQDSAFGLLLGARSPDAHAVLTALVNVADNLPGPAAFVVDDYHLIEDPAIHEALAFLLDQLPSTIHFVLACRGEPPLPLARYRARRELLEIRTEDLQFSQAETAELLNRVMGLDLTDDQVAGVQRQLEGWIAGLQLFALTAQGSPTTADRLMVSGRHRFIADYLHEDVLAHLPEAVRRFLLQTSILHELCSGLCEAVTGSPGGQEMLDQLDKDNLFLVSLDDNRQWFRYHQIFGDFLREALMRQSQAEAFDLHRRAARWYFTNDLPEPAMHHAIASEDPELVIQIGERYFELKLMSGEFNLLQHWLTAIPGRWQSDYPALGLGRAAFLTFTGAFEDSSRCLDELEQRLAPVEGEQARWLMARVTALRCALACIYNDLPRAETLAASALQALPAVDHATQAMIHQALGDTYRRNRHWQAARDRYLAALTLVHDSAFRIRSVHVLGALADLELQQGRLQAAAAYWAKALTGSQGSDTWGKFPLPLLGWVYIRLGEIAYEWNELGRASDYLARGSERVELGGDARARLAGYVITGRLKLTAGEMAAAGECLERARGVVESAPFPEWMERLERLQIEYWLAQDQLRTVVDWADRQLPAPVSVAQANSQTGHLALARVLIVIGDMSSVAKALAILQRLLQTVDQEGRAAAQIEALILMALIRWRKGERADAMAHLDRALRLAEPEGYVRLFADLGLPVARLLQEAYSRGVMPDYLGRLLTAFGADAGIPASQAGALPEPLTRREREILALVAAGLTNREIAEKLVLSAETVKKHAGMIFSKLGVSNRTEAAARARALGLLD